MRCEKRNRQLLVFPMILCYIKSGGEIMDTKSILLELRKKNGLSQDELAEKVFVTRQAVSRWENGDSFS